MKKKSMKFSYFIVQTPDGDEWWLDCHDIIELKRTEVGHLIAKFKIDGRVRVGIVRSHLPDIRDKT